MSSDPPQTPSQIAETILQDPRERKRLTAFALSRYGIRHEDAEDLLQDTAVELLRRRKHIHSPRGFLFSAFRTCCKKFVFRLRSRGQSIPLTGDEASAAHDPDRLDLAFSVRQGLGAVSAACRKILTAHYILGESLKQTAVSAGYASSGLPTIVSRCLKKLRTCLA
jgi:DNA-directed RNA polymerase specialized sigma24 family protein